jgi:anaphase-promoting complex subunit 5
LVSPRSPTCILNCTDNPPSTDWAACGSLFEALRPDASTDPEISFLLREARIDYLVSRGHFSDAFNAIEDSAASLKEQGADILQRVSMLILRATLFAKVGKPERAFSAALRAASVSFKAKLMPSLWCAVGLLANILSSMGEFAAAERLLHAVIPQVCIYGAADPPPKLSIS